VIRGDDDQGAGIGLRKLKGDFNGIVKSNLIEYQPGGIVGMRGLIDAVATESVTILLRAAMSIRPRCTRPSS